MAESSKDLYAKVQYAKTLVKNNEDALRLAKKGTKNYNDLMANLKKFRGQLEDFQTQYDAAKLQEDTAKTNKENASTKKTYQSQVDAWEDRVAAAEKSLEIAQNSGGDVQGATNYLATVKGQKPKEPTYKAAPQPTSTPETGGQETPPSAGKDSDGDGIPDTIDKEPTKSNKPTTPSGTTGGKTTPSVTAEKTKQIWINHLTEAFKNVGDPKAQVQIDALFKRASAKGSGYTEAAFLAELNNIDWWRNQKPSLQKYFLLTHDPSKAGTLAEKREFQSNNLKTIMADAGIELNNIDPVTGQIIDNSNIFSGLVEKAIANNWDENQFKHYVATSADLHFTRGGLIQSKVDKLQDVAKLYGITVDATMLKDMQTSMLDPTNSRNDTWWSNEFKNMAINQYKPFAAAIQGGSSLYNATYNYRTQMANLLEIAPENITWKDLMSGVIDPKTGNARVESDFVAQVKQNPLWQRTANAKETYMGMFNDLAREFGITG